jgi:hypothetical protein
MGVSLAIEIVEAVADAEGVDPMELDFRLQEHVDVEALELLESHGSDSWTLSIELPRHEVTVTGQGSVLVTSARDELRP